MSAMRCSLAVLFCFVLLPQSALAQSPLPHARSYLVTGDYAVGGVDMTGQGVNGFVTGTIPMSGIPANVNILAAFLYWETIASTANPSAAAGVQFRGVPIDIDNVNKVKKSSSILAGPTATCWSSGSPVTMTKFRADVLSLLPEQKDANGAPTGRHIVNTADLLARGLPEHLVRLPKVGTWTESAGATLLVVYQNSEPDSAQIPNPLRKIVVYDGIQIQAPGTTLTQPLRGFYKSAAIKSARITHIAAINQKNQGEAIFFNGSRLATNAFPDSATPLSERAWANPTFNVSSLMPGTSSAQYGETATTATGQHKVPAYECLSWGAVVFSTAVADVDRDGLPDGLEDAVAGLSDPNGDQLPNLNAMGASSLHKDVFIEINAMLAAPGTTYGSPDAPYSATLTQKTDSAGHLHMPRPVVLKMVGDALRDAPFTNADGSPGIKAHFDVGNIQDYHCLSGACQSVEANEYLVPSALARGGELIQESACVQTETDICQFPAYPGTVGWKVGLEWHRDGPVGDNGEELLTTPELEAWLAGGAKRQRFDPERRGMFHYMLYAHARGAPRSPDPCLDSNGDPTAYNDSGTCTVARNPRFHVPITASGKADLPGSDALISLGFWDNFTGTPFIQASTTLHELGHNWDLWHGSLRGTRGDALLGTTNYVEPNCKPNYLSVMSYLFQANGLLDVEGDARIDFSGDVYANIDETSLLDAGLTTPLRYRTSWFAPLLPGTIGVAMGVPPAKSFCSGSRLPNPLPPGWIDIGRIDALAIADPIDWNADGDALDAAFLQDVNFDGALSGAYANPATPEFQGANDWTSLRLDQTGGGRGAAGFSSGGLGFDADSGGLSFDGDSGGLGFDADSGGLGFDADSGGLGFDADSGGLGFDADTGGQELEVEVIREWSNTPPTGFRACQLGVDCPGVQPAPGSPDYNHVQMRWTEPHVADGRVVEYRIARAVGGTVTPASVFVQAGTSTTTTFTDAELPHNVVFTYLVRAVSADGIVSGPSNVRTFTGHNEAPVANADHWATTGPLVVAAATGVLANDTDVDTPTAALRARLVSGPSSGSLTLNADGSFTYVPVAGFKGFVTFTYVANSGSWSLDPSVPMSADSAPATVIITVKAAKR